MASHTPFGPRPVFQITEDKPSHELPSVDNITVQDGLLHCTQHMKQVCADCNIDYSTHNFLSRQLTANQGALPPPNPQTTQAIQRLKSEGNDMYRGQCHFEAAQKYTEALMVASQRPLWDNSQTSIEEISVLLSNRAACLLEMGMVSEAYWDTEVVTRLKKGWSKGHFRMGRALEGLGRCGAAHREYMVGAQLEPGAKEIRAAYEKVGQFI